MNSLTRLFEPGSIGTMELGSRIIMAPMGTLFANEDGSVSERLCRYYEERAKGGVALIIVEVTAVARGGKAHPRELGIYEDEFIPGLRRLVDSVHRYGASVAIQLHHTGRQTTAEAACGLRDGGASSKQGQRSHAGQDDRSRSSGWRHGRNDKKAILGQATPILDSYRGP
ncbi:MAG: hypothetical protein KAW81_02985 [Dehalococcoidia bacterium]|nr:hypothetical protein [Dehalococcoidia bacterium]